MIRRDFFKATLAVAGLSLQPEAVSNILAAEERFPNAPGLTKYVSEFIVNTKYEEIPEEVIELGKKSLLDAFGLALCGAASPISPLVWKYMEMSGVSGGQATVMGTGRKLPLRFAAFANGVSIHANDFDDTQLAAEKDRVYGKLVHPTVTVLPPAFAMSEMGKCSGKELLLAYHVGVEVETKITEAISPRHYNDGFHSTGTCGSFGSAAACAKLRRLDALKTAYALGIVAAEAGGLNENLGSMTKPFQAGHAAENGTVAADLASLGWTAADNILEAPAGYFHAAGGSFDNGLIMNRLGKPWTFASPGISIKPFPCGSLAHPAMGEFLRLIRENKIKAADVEKIDIGGNHSMTTTLLAHHPMNGLQGKFSMEFCLSILLLEGKAGLSEFTDAVVQRSDVQDMIRRVNFYVDPEAEAAGFDKMTSLLKIHLKDGRVISGRAEFAKGSPANPMSYEEVTEKFMGNVEFAKWPAQKSKTIVEAVKSFEKQTDVSGLTAALTS